MTTISQAVAASRRAMIAREPAMAAELVRHYQVAWDAVERDLQELTRLIDAAIARGEPVSETWLRRQQWFLSLQESIEQRMVQFGGNGAHTLAVTQQGAVQLALNLGTAYRTALGSAFDARVWSTAFEHWVSALQPNSPLQGVLSKYGDRVAESITRRITEGLGTGQGMDSVVKAIIGDVGPDVVEGNLRTLVRTEGMRAYRGAGREELSAVGATIPGQHEWEWLAALSDRTCPACLAMHRKRFPFDQYPDHFHVGCRCIARLVIDEAIVPRVGSVGMTGDEWLRTRPAAVQRKLLRTKGRYDAFRKGAPLNDFVTVTHDDTWGNSIVLTPSREVA